LTTPALPARLLDADHRFTPRGVYTQEENVPENQGDPFGNSEKVLRIAYFLVTKATPLALDNRIIGYRVPVREFERLRNKVLEAQAITIQEQGVLDA